MSDQHTTLLIVSCDDALAHEIMESASARGATYSVYTANALEDLRRGDTTMMREALFGPDPWNVAPVALTPGTTQADLSQTGGAGDSIQ
jgi:hypothetical protein